MPVVRRFGLAPIPWTLDGSRIMDQEVFDDPTKEAEVHCFEKPSVKEVWRPDLLRAGCW